MAKYDKKSQEKVKEAMHEMKEGKLKTGSGKKVTDKDQAVAIGLSEARKEGSKAPKKKSSTSVSGTKRKSSKGKDTATDKTPAQKQSSSQSLKGKGTRKSKGSGSASG